MESAQSHGHAEHIGHADHIGDAGSEHAEHASMNHTGHEHHTMSIMVEVTVIMPRTFVVGS